MPSATITSSVESEPSQERQCRICMDTDEEMVDVSRKERKNNETKILFEAYETIIGKTHLEDAKLPTFVCSGCVCRIKKCFLLRIKGHTSYDKLLQFNITNKGVAAMESCRICLRQDDKLINIFRGVLQILEGETKALNVAFEESIGIKVQEHDGITCLLCRDCLSGIEESVLLRRLAEEVLRGFHESLLENDNRDLMSLGEVEVEVPENTNGRYEKESLDKNKINEIENDLQEEKNNDPREPEFVAEREVTPQRNSEPREVDKEQTGTEEPIIAQLTPRRTTRYRRAPDFFKIDEVMTEQYKILEKEAEDNDEEYLDFVEEEEEWDEDLNDVDSSDSEIGEATIRKQAQISKVDKKRPSTTQQPAKPENCVIEKVSRNQTRKRVNKAKETINPSTTQQPAKPENCVIEKVSRDQTRKRVNKGKETINSKKQRLNEDNTNLNAVVRLARLKVINGQLAVRPEVKSSRSGGSYFKGHPLLLKAQPYKREKQNLNPEKQVRRYQCRICDKKFIKKNHLDVHERLHFDIKAYSCSYCGKKFTQRGNMVVHIRIHHTKEKPFACEICGKTFAVKSDCKNHTDTHSKPKRYKCELCPRVFHRHGNYKTHLRVHSDARPFSCPICSRKFAIEHTMKIHAATHDKLILITCVVKNCGREFSNNGNYKQHLPTHWKENIFVCDTCSKQFQSLSSLKSHTAKSHKLDRPFVCDICKMAFSNASILLTHKRSHPDGHYTCHVCSKEFTQSATYKKHIYKSHKDANQRHACHLCSLLFDDDFESRRHYNLHHKNEKHTYHCSICSKKFTKPLELKTHMTTKHAKETSKMNIKIPPSLIERTAEENKRKKKLKKAEKDKIEKEE